MTLGVIVFAAVFLVGLVLGSATRRPLPIASVVVEPFVAFASFALIALAGLVVDSVRETVGLLLGR